MRKVRRFEWDRGNIHKPAKHGVSVGEAEEVFYNRPLFKRTHTGRYLALGVTDAGRYLLVVFEYRAGAVRVVTARDMKKSERRYYLRERGE